MRYAILILCLLIASSRPAIAAEPRVLTEADIGAPRADWYGVYGPKNEKIGYAQCKISRSEKGYTQTNLIHMSVAAMGQENGYGREQDLFRRGTASLRQRLCEIIANGKGEDDPNRTHRRRAARDD